MNIDHVAARRTLRKLRSTSKAGTGRGVFDAWMAADKAAHELYLSLFTDDEKALVVEKARELSARLGLADVINTFETAIAAHGTSAIDAALGDEV